MQTSIWIFIDQTTVPKQVSGTGKITTSWFYAAHRDDGSFGDDLLPTVAYSARSPRSIYQIRNIFKGCTAIFQHGRYAGCNRLDQPGTVFKEMVLNVTEN